MRYIIPVLMLALILVSACSNDTITAMPVSEIKTAEIVLEANVTENDPCENITCGSNELCDDGECVCEDNYKKCEDACIAESMCCKDDDCEESKTCEDNVCITTNCKYNQHYDTSRGECVCDQGYSYCAAQKKCIAKNSCCMHVSCSTYERCVETLYKAIVCMDGEKLMCRSVMSNRPEVFMINSERYDVILQDVFQDEVIGLDVNEEGLKLKVNQIKRLNENLTIYIEEFEVIGGYCKEDTA